MASSSDQSSVRQADAKPTPDLHQQQDAPSSKRPVQWHRSTFFNITVLGLCNFAAPGIWGAMNSLGAGGAQKPYLVNTANALTFCLMVVSCWLGSGLVKVIGIKGALIFGTYVYFPFLFPSFLPPLSPCHMCMC